MPKSQVTGKDSTPTTKTTGQSNPRLSYQITPNTEAKIHWEHTIQAYVAIHFGEQNSTKTIEKHPLGAHNSD